MSMSNVYLLSSLLWLLGDVPRAVVSQPVLTRFSPRSGPTRGGTNISVWGSGFEDITRCNFANLPAASVPSLTAIVHNSTFMTCILPEFTSAFQFPEDSTHNIIQFRIVTSYTNQSSEEDFLVFNLTNILVTNLNPTGGFILSLDNYVSFSGNGFVDTSELYCFIGDLREPATFINEQMISCLLPSFPTPSLQYPRLSLNGDDSGFVPIQDGSNMFTFYSTAPNLEKVEFSSSGAQLILIFDREVEIGRENSTRVTQSFECSEIFNVDTSNLLGEAAKCDWQTSQQRVIIVQLHVSSSIMPNDFVTLNGESIRTRAVEYSMLSTSSVVIPVPEGPVPVAVLEAPGTIPECGMLKLVARNSLYGGGRPFDYNWSASTGNQTLDDMIAMSYESAIEIPVSSFVDPGPYNFTVDVTNFLGLQDNTTIQLHKSVPGAISVTIYGGHTRYYPVDSDNIVIEATAEILSCSTVNGMALEYLWTITNSLDGAVITLGLAATNNNSELWIPPLILQPGIMYDIQVSAQYPGQSLTAGMAVIQVTGLHPVITAALQTGYRSSVRITESIYLDTSPSRGLLPDQTYQYLWSCDSCELSDTFPSDSPSSLTLPPNSLSLGSYQFTVSITHPTTGTSSMASTIIEVIEAQTRGGKTSPSVSISLPNKWNALSANDKTVVRASVSVPSAATVEWSTVEVKGLGYDHKPIDDLFTNTPKSYSAKSRNDLSTLGDDVKLSSVLVASSSESLADNKISLTVNPNALKSGVSYRMRLNATTEDGYSTTAEIDITTGTQPTSGKLLITPSDGGTALNTLFTITAVDWTDHFGDPPLLYQFGFRLSQQSTKIHWLSSIKYNSQISSYLPIAPNSNGSIVLVLRVYDRSAAFVTHEMNFGNIVDEQPYDAQVLINSIRDQVTRYGQISQGLASITAVVASLNEYSSKFTSTTAFRNDSVNFLLDMSHQVNPTKPSLNQILFLLDYVTNGMTFSNTIQQRLVAFLECVIEKYQMFQNRFIFSTPGFNIDEASAVFTLYGRLLGNATTRLLRTNNAASSYLNMIDKLSYGICRQLGLNEEMVIAEETFGSLKLSHYTPANQFTASCVNSENSACPFSQQTTVDVDFSTALFNRYISWQCKSSLTCSGVCLTSVQLVRNILWDGNPYLWHTKSPSLSLYVINPNDGTIEVVEGLSEPVELRFPITASNSTSRCVYWDVREQGWSTRGCSTIEDNGITCSCDHFSDFTVLAVCPSGYYGDQCQFTCPSNMYGEECSNQCTCSITNGNCSPIDGSCDCNPGYTGSTCTSECDEGYYGKNCLQQCQCMNDATCDHVDGMCRCTAGWTGTRCAAKCPQGTYGQNCIEVCTCRNITKCNHITGSCSCESGYTGDDCKQECPYPLHGDNCEGNCSSACDVNGTAAMECHHIDGPNCTCNAGYIGDLCQTNTIIPSPLPPVTPMDPAGFPVAVLAIIPVILLLIIMLIATIIVVNWRWKKYHSGRAKIAPADEEDDTEQGAKRSIFDGEEHIRLTKAESMKMISKMNSFEEEDGIRVTRTKSLTVIVPAGAKLQDMFSESQQGAFSFKEPPEHGGKFRWQIIRLREKPTVTDNDGPSGSKDALIPKEKGDDEELALKQMRYEQGVYVDPDATLREVRDLFIETGQLELDEVLFQFLDPNSHNKLFSIEEEDAITLDSMELKLPRTLFIKSIPDSKENRLDFCLCGQVADFECTDCNAQGYCSVECQQEDWHKHMLTCKKLRKKKKKSKKKKKDPYQLHSPDPNMCVCGAPAEMECSQCGIQGYCSEKCQIADWDEHQLICEPHPSSKPVTPTNNSAKEVVPTENIKTASIGTGSVPSITPTDDNKDEGNNDTAGSLFGSNVSLLNDKV